MLSFAQCQDSNALLEKEMIKFLGIVAKEYTCFSWIAYQMWNNLVLLQIWPNLIQIEFKSQKFSSIKDYRGKPKEA